MFRKKYNISVIIPWRKSQQRDRNMIADWCFQRYKFLLPDAEFIYSDSGDEIFSRGKSINKGVEECNGDYIIITDADYLFSEAMVKEIINKQPWTVAVKQNNYFYLNGAITNLLLVKHSPEINIKEFNFGNNISSCPFYVYGGVMAMPKENFIKFDPFLEGYGYEDNVWSYTMNAVFGKEHRTNQKMYHMCHLRITNNYMKKSYDNKAYHDKVWLPIVHNKKAIKKLIIEKGLYSL